MKLASLDAGAIQVMQALDQRLAAVAPVLLGFAPEPESVPGTYAARVLPDLVTAVGTRPGPRAWLLLTALKGAFPLASEVQRLARRIELSDPDDVVFELLDATHSTPGSANPHLHMDLVTDKVVVDVHHCATDDNHTGIQRVTRSVVPLWHAEHEIVAVAQTAGHTGLRTLRERESARVFSFGQEFEASGDTQSPPRLVVPWGTVVVLPEVPSVWAQRRLACLAEYSGNTMSIIGYDMIPILSGHLRPVGEGGHFSQYLIAVKHSHRVAGISRSATAEFRGFGRMLSAQGLEGPVVAEIELAEEVPAGVGPAWTPPPRPVVLIPGRREVHKNVRACVQAAHRLWAEGLDFEVVTLGGAGWSEGPLDETVRQLKAEGFPLTTLGWVPDDEMWQQIRAASFVVFASRHEGYGLPISEALNLGTPVVTSNYGSQAEIAERGGCLMVDPRSDTAIADAMRELITDPGRLSSLRAEIPLRPRRGWADYAGELWSFLVDGKEPKQ